MEIACVFVVPNTFASALPAVAHTPVRQTPVSNGRCPVASCPLPLEGRPLRTLLTLERENLTEWTASEVQ
jgi:hypothetical protein